MTIINMTVYISSPVISENACEACRTILASKRSLIRNRSASREAFFLPSVLDKVRFNEAANS